MLRNVSARCCSVRDPKDPLSYSGNYNGKSYNGKPDQFELWLDPGAEGGIAAKSAGSAYSSSRVKQHIVFVEDGDAQRSGMSLEVLRNYLVMFSRADKPTLKTENTIRSPSM